ncbi:MAG: ribonuclease HI, partial [Candidatus Delongbacteria bacterium]|nr:ribonuclease HI [Candidatus Delongbacteria bacterium]MCG2760774.1 ribonuclease HI [Candidatus Delongbacteria bacterium]
MKEVTIYADGACSKNPGPGGWGVVLICGNYKKELSGYSELTTNNIMELTAVIEGMNALKEKCKIDVYTDSKYIVDSVTKWLSNWQKNGWKTYNKKPIKNIEFWGEIVNLIGFHQVNWHWIKGH